MKIIALSMAYNEEALIYKSLAHLYDLIDEFIVFHGTVSPFDDQPSQSTDNTSAQIGKFTIDVDRKKGNKITYWAPNKNNSIKSREVYEGWVKNEMLKLSHIEEGDIIFQLDTDEFYTPEGFSNIVELFRKDDQLESVVVEEYQHAYKLGLVFDASHQGRFIRYKKGGQYTASQHFFYPNNNQDISRTGPILSREFTTMHHLCWMRKPELIRQKVLTFKRQSFTNWYNNCFLVYPFDPEKAYENNKKLSAPMGWPGNGFAEGQNTRLYKFMGQLPEILIDIKEDWENYIRQNYKDLLIK